jgi:hypothetical protein
MHLKIPNELLYYLYPIASQLRMAVTVFIDEFYDFKNHKKHSEEIELFANPFNLFYVNTDIFDIF